jgi:hypothetical protein
MIYAQWRTTFSYVHLGTILMLVLGFYSGLSGRVRRVYLFSLCVVSLLSSRFPAICYSTFYFTGHRVHLGARGSVVGCGTMLQAGR